MTVSVCDCGRDRRIVPQQACASAARVFYGDSHRCRMVTDASEMGGLLPEDSMWAWAFKAVARVQGRQWQLHRPGVRQAWAAVVALEGTDIEAGTMEAAMWMGRALVQLACKYKLMPLSEVPEAMQEECGVRLQDIVADPPAPAQPGKGGKPKRNREEALVTDVETQGGPILKKTKEDLNEDGDSEATKGDSSEAGGSRGGGGGGVSSGRDNSDIQRQASGGVSAADAGHQPTPMSQWASCDMTAGRAFF